MGWRSVNWQLFQHKESIIFLDENLSLKLGTFQVLGADWYLLDENLKKLLDFLKG